MNLKEYEQNFTMNIQQKLKTKIKGRIYVEVNWHDEIYVSIINTDNIKWEHRIVNFSERFLHGWSSEYAAYEIMSEYKKFVFEKAKEQYFYND